MIAGYDADHDVSGVLFDNFVLGGRRVGNADHHAAAGLLGAILLAQAGHGLDAGWAWTVAAVAGATSTDSNVPSLVRRMR